MANQNGALAFDAVIDTSELDKNLRQSGNNVSGFTKKAVDEFDKLDKAVKKSADNIKTAGIGKVDAKKTIDFTSAERSLYGFNQKLERTGREMGVTFQRSGRDAMGFSSQFETSVQKAQKSYERFAGSAQAESTNISSSFRGIAAAAIGFSAVGALASLPGQIVKVRGEFEGLEITLKTILGSKAEADRLLQEVVTLAATTPFGLKEASQATKQLIAYGVASGEVIGVLHRLGDVAAGLKIPIGDLTYLYGTLRAQGRAYQVDINQFALRGIPIYEELAKVLKINDDQVKSFIEAGKVGFKEIEQVFINLTGEGGKFFNLLNEQAGSITQLYAAIGDKIDIAFNDIGKSQEGFIKASLQGTLSIVENYESIIDALKVVALTYGTYRAAIMLASAATRANLILTEAMAVQQALAAASGITLSVAQARAAATTVLLQRAQAGLNATMLANPYILAATALAALIGYFAIYRSEVSETEAAEKRLANNAATVAVELGKEQAKIQSLTNQIKGLNGDREKQSEKVRELIALNPSLLGAINAENIATKESVKSINDYISGKKRQIEIANIQKELDASYERSINAKNGKGEPGFLDIVKEGLSGANSMYATANQSVKKYEAAKVNSNKRIETSEEALQKKLLGQLEGIQKVDEAARKSGKNEEAAVAVTVKALDEKIQAKKAEQEANSTNHTKFLAYEKEIQALEKQRTAITGKLTKQASDAAKEAEKRGPYGSVQYWEYITSKAKELLEKTPTDKTNLLDSRKQDVVESERKLEEARKQIAVRGFEEELDEKRRQYELYYKWVEAYGEDAANKQFKTLVDSGQSYVQYLDSEIAKLKSTANFTALNANDLSKLSMLTDQRNSFTGQQSGLDDFKKKLEDAKESSANLTEQLEKLRQIQSQLNAPVTSDDYKKRQIIAEELVNIEKERRDALATFLQSVNGSGQKELEITKHYADLKAQVDKDYNAGRIADREDALAKITKAEQDELNEQAVLRAQGSKEYKALNDYSGLTGTAAIKEEIEEVTNYMNRLKIEQGESSEEYKQYVDKLKSLNKELKTSTSNDFDKVIDSIGALGSAFSSLGDSSGNGFAQLLGEFGQGVGLVNRALKESKKASEEGADGFQKYLAAAAAVVQIIGMISSSAKERKAKEKEYYDALVEYETQYQLLLNKRILNQAQDNENIFITDYEGRIKSGVAAYADAQEKYLAAVEKVAEEGMAKTGQKRKADWNKAGKGAASGAAAGAAFGPWGAAVGGVVGFAAGLFGGKKTVDTFGPIKEKFKGLFEVGEDGFRKINKEMAQAALASGLLDDNTKSLVENALEYADAMEEAKDQIQGAFRDLAGDIGSRLTDALVGAFEAGTDGALALKALTEDIVESFIKNMVVTSLFKPALDQYQKDLNESASLGGDGNYVDDTIKLYQALGPVVGQVNEVLGTLQDKGKEFGLDLFTGDKAAPQSLTGAIATISQESANELNAQFNAMRLSQARMEQVTNFQLIELRAINQNTSGIPVLVQLGRDQLFYLRNSDATLTRIAG